MVDVSQRAGLIARGAAQWRDRGSAVRSKAREALRDSAWSAEVIEAALDDVLADLDEERARVLMVDRGGRHECRPLPPSSAEARVLVVLPGNIIGPAIASAYCAVLAGARIILKSAADERALAPIVAEQFEALGPPLAGMVESRYWIGGDAAIEAAEFAEVRKIVAFGSDEAIAEIERRSPVPVKGYGTSYSVGFVDADADVRAAASGAARDVSMFDQRGCMSPQTIYVEGDDGRALLFAHALAAALGGWERTSPRSRIDSDEATAVAMAVRRISATALAPRTHGLETLLQGPKRSGVPSFVVAVEAHAAPALEGFGRIAVVMPCATVDALAATLGDAARTVRFETLGVGSRSAAPAQLARHFRRTCPLGEMQRPPFGYRPTVEDFA